MKNARSVSILLYGIPTDVTVIAKRGAMLYGVCLSPRNSIALMELIETPAGVELKETKNSLSFSETQREKREVDNNVQVSVSVFLGNALLKSEGMEERVRAKVFELIASIPEAKVYDF